MSSVIKKDVGNCIAAPFEALAKAMSHCNKQAPVSAEDGSTVHPTRADVADSRAHSAQQAPMAADQGGEAMRSISDELTQIRRSSDETAKAIGTIQEITLQTHLLALSTAAAAAREFAVMARAVRNLAQHSVDAARKASAVLEQSAVGETNGIKMTDEVSRILERIAAQLMAEVAESNRVLAQGRQKLDGFASQMDRVSAPTAESPSQCADPCTEGNVQPDDLEDLTGVLMGRIQESKTDDESRPLADSRRRPQASGNPIALRSQPPMCHPLHARATVVDPNQVIHLEDDDWNSLQHTGPVEQSPLPRRDENDTEQNPGSASLE